MVMRTSTRDASRRAQTSMSRATLRELNSKTLWSEAKQIDVMASETATDVEYAESYGTTSVPAKQDKDDDQQKQQPKQQQAGGDGGPGGSGGTPSEEGEQPKGDAAEAIVAYLNGSRSHPVILAIGDRRHRLKELEEGDVAQYRLKDDRQQFLLHKDGTYLSTRDDKVFRAALVPKEQKDQQQAAGSQQAKSQQKEQKTYGQKSARDDNKKSEIAIEQNGQQTYSQHGQQYATQKGGSDSTIHTQKSKTKSAQSTDKHTHIRFNEHRIFNDDEGNWCTSPLLVKKDQHCKEG